MAGEDRRIARCPRAAAQPRAFHLEGVGFVWFAALLLLAGCDRKEVARWFRQAPAEQQQEELELFEPRDLATGMKALTEAAKKPVQALSLLVYPDHMVLQAQNPDAPNEVYQFVYRNGAVGERVRVKLLGNGKLEDNLFPLDAAHVRAVPDLVEKARERVDIPEGIVTRVLLKRNLPESMDIQFRVFVTSQRRDGYLDADKDGNVIEVKP